MTSARSGKNGKNGKNGTSRASATDRASATGATSRASAARSAPHRAPRRPAPSAASGPPARPSALARFAARHWDGAPAVLAGGAPPLPPAALYRLAQRAAAPFIAGTRFRAIPDVRFFAGPDRLRAPGERLPLSGDRTLAAYLGRARRGAAAGFQLQIVHPLLLDFALWDGARAWLDELWAAVGVPVLPVTSELLLGDWRAGAGSSAPRPHHTALTVVLAGELTAHLTANQSSRLPSGQRTKPLTLRGRAGDVLLWSPRFRHQDEGARGLALRFWVPAAGAGLADAVKDVAVSLMERRIGPHHPVPYLPLPRRGRATAAPLARAAELLAEIARDELPRALQIQWAKRVSAAALEPAPAALAADELAAPGGAPATAALELLAEPLRMPLGAGLAIWAVHGHAFSLRHERGAAQVLAELRRGPLRLAELAPELQEAARELAAQLLRLRAARWAGAARRPPLAAPQEVAR